MAIKEVTRYVTDDGLEFAKKSDALIEELTKRTVIEFKDWDIHLEPSQVRGLLEFFTEEDGKMYLQAIFACQGHEYHAGDSGPIEQDAG